MSQRTISVEAVGPPGFSRSHQLLQHPSFLRQSLRRGRAQWQPWGKGLSSAKPGAGLEENEAKSNVFIWTLCCLTVLYLQMCWVLLTALKVQLVYETWLETWHFYSESPCVKIRSRERAASVLMVVYSLKSGARCRSSVAGHWINHWDWSRAETSNFLCQLRQLVLPSHTASCAPTTLPFPLTHLFSLTSTQPWPPSQCFLPNGVPDPPWQPPPRQPLLSRCMPQVMVSCQASKSPCLWTLLGTYGPWGSTEWEWTFRLYKTRPIKVFRQGWWKSMLFNDELCKFNLETTETQRDFGLTKA